MGDDKAFGEALQLLVHDLRNPAATLIANADFVRDGLAGNALALEAMDDMSVAMDDMMHGLTRMAWIATALAEGGSFLRDGDVRSALEETFVLDVKTDGASFVAKGGADVAALVAIFVEAAEAYKKRAPAIELHRDGEFVVIGIEGSLDPSALTLAGQREQKRSVSFCGFLAAQSFVKLAGGTIRCSPIEIRLPVV